MDILINPHNFKVLKSGELRSLKTYHSAGSGTS